MWARTKGKKMNRRLEDKIAMLAFGELSDTEAAEVRAVAAGDAEATKLLKSYESIRSGFRSMADSVPPDQLSKERLQDAILKQGLREKESEKPRRWFGWVLAPAALTLIVATVLVMRGGGADESTNMVGLAPEKADFTLEKLQNDADFSLGSPVAEPPKGSEPISTVPAVVDDARAAKSVVSNNTVRRSSVARKTTRRAVDETPGPDRFDTQPIQDGSMKMTLAVNNTPQPKVILIQNIRDNSTGALKAVETEAFQGVLVGS
jgi:hypothetical protein